MAIRNRETKKMKKLLGDEREEGRRKSKTSFSGSHVVPL